MRELRAGSHVNFTGRIEVLPPYRDGRNRRNVNLFKAGRYWDRRPDLLPQITCAVVRNYCKMAVSGSTFYTALWDRFNQPLEVENRRDVIIREKK
jgi:hypothetical protein